MYPVTVVLSAIEIRHPMCLTSRMTDGHTEGSNAESIDSNEAESTQTIVTRVVDMKSCFLAGRFGEACALAKEELQALRDEVRFCFNDGWSV